MKRLLLLALLVLPLGVRSQSRVLILDPLGDKGLENAELGAIRAKIGEGVSACGGIVAIVEGNYRKLAEGYLKTEAIPSQSAKSLVAETDAQFAIYTNVASQAADADAELNFVLRIIDLRSTQTLAEFSFRAIRSGIENPKEAFAAIINEVPDEVSAVACGLFKELGVGTGETTAGQTPTVGPRPDAAKEVAFIINQVRNKPVAYTQEYGVDLSYLAARPALNWNETLAAVAQKKAEDMYRRQYFSHVDPDGNGINILIHEAGYTLAEGLRKTRKMNTFESISAGHTDPAAIVRQLIIDEGVTPPGHRHHLLGHEQFWGTCTDIGVGVFASDDRYTGYCVIIIAKHDY